MDERNEPSITVHGNDVLLRPWKTEDAEWYVKSRDEAVFQWTTERRDLTVAQTREAILHANANPDAFCFAIVERAGMTILGNIALVLQENDRRSAEVMYWLALWGRGHGVATKSVRLICHWAFSALELERVTLKTHPENLRSQRVAERSGFLRQKSFNLSDSDKNYLWYELINYFAE